VYWYFPPSWVVRIAVFAAPGISASPSEENMRYFNVMILGPSQWPYEGEESSPLVLLFFILIALDIMYIFEL
jgi:hypothetical protein